MSKLTSSAGDVRPREEAYAGSDEEDDGDCGYIPKSSRNLRRPDTQSGADAAVRAALEQQRGPRTTVDYNKPGAPFVSVSDLVDMDERREQDLELPDDTDFEADCGKRQAALRERQARREALLSSKDVRFIWEA